MSQVPVAVLSKYQAALSLLRSGQAVQARALLTEIIFSEPSFVDAHWVLGGVLYESGALESALKALQTVVRLDPSRSAAHMMCGRIFAALGKSKDAEMSFRSALKISCDPSTAAMLARVLIAQKQFGEARLEIEPFLGASDASQELLMLHGHASMMLEEPLRASGSFRRLVDISPKDADASLRLAAALCDAGKYVDAEVYARRAIALSTNVEAHFILGRTLMGQCRMAEAEGELRQVVRMRPMHIMAQNNLCELLWMQSGSVDTAGKEIDTVLRNHPAISALRISKAKLLLAAEDPFEAMREIERGLSITPNDFDLLLAGAQIGLELDARGALEHSRRALQLMPGNSRALAAYGDALLAVGKACQAVAIATKWVAREPSNGRGIALLGTAMRMAGDPEYRVLFDYDNFVRTQTIDVPKGWGRLQDYLHELASALRRLHSLSVHPIGQSLRHGSQLELDLEGASEPAIAAFAEAISGPINRYIEALGQGSDPMRSRNAGRFWIKGAWSVRLRSQGFHVNHFHPEGWISSACYIELPPAIDFGQQEGWLQFGEPAFKTLPRLLPEHFVKPELGLLALFPSYMWHGTVPFSGGPGDERLTIAFDVLPSTLRK